MNHLPLIAVAISRLNDTMMPIASYSNKPTYVLPCEETIIPAKVDVYNNTITSYDIWYLTKNKYHATWF